MNTANPPFRARARASLLSLVLGALAVAASANADVVQGTLSPADAKVVIKNAAGSSAGGPFQQVAEALSDQRP